MASYGKTVTHRPVDDDEAQTHDHEGYAQRSKAGSLGVGGVEGGAATWVLRVQQQPNQHINGMKWGGGLTRILGVELMGSFSLGTIRM